MPSKKDRAERFGCGAQEAMFFLWLQVAQSLSWFLDQFGLMDWVVVFK